MEFKRIIIFQVWYKCYKIIKHQQNEMLMCSRHTNWLLPIKNLPKLQYICILFCSILLKCWLLPFCKANFCLWLSIVVWPPNPPKNHKQYKTYIRFTVCIWHLFARSSAVWGFHSKLELIPTYFTQIFSSHLNILKEITLYILTFYILTN